MTLNDLLKLKGRTVLVPSGLGCSFLATILDAVGQYGHDDQVLLEPVAGKGSAWYNLKSVQLHPEGATV